MSKQPFICEPCQVMGCEDRCWCCGREWTRLSWVNAKTPHVHVPTASRVVWSGGVTIPIEDEVDELV